VVGVGGFTTLEDSALAATDLFAAIRAAGVQRESPLLVATLEEFAAGRLAIREGQVVDASDQPAPPADLTAQVEAIVASTVH
jgi:hypothetical protein